MKHFPLLLLLALVSAGCLGISTRVANVQEGKLDCSAGTFVFEAGRDVGGVISPVDPLVMAFTDADLAATLMSASGNIDEIDLTRARITRAALDEIVRLAPRVRSLNLAATSLSDDDLPVLQGLTSLETLHLSKTSLSDAGCVNIASLPKLKKLELSMTQITDAGLERLCAAGRAVQIICIGTRVSDKGVERIRKLYPKVLIENHNRVQGGVI